MGRWLTALWLALTIAGCNFTAEPGKAFGDGGAESDAGLVDGDGGHGGVDAGAAPDAHTPDASPVADSGLPVDGAILDLGPADAGADSGDGQVDGGDGQVDGGDGQVDGGDGSPDAGSADGGDLGTDVGSGSADGAADVAP